MGIRYRRHIWPTLMETITRTDDRSAHLESFRNKANVEDQNS